MREHGRTTRATKLACGSRLTWHRHSVKISIARSRRPKSRRRLGFGFGGFGVVLPSPASPPYPTSSRPLLHNRGAVGRDWVWDEGGEGKEGQGQAGLHQPETPNSETPDLHGSTIFQTALSDPGHAGFRVFGR